MVGTSRAVPAPDDEGACAPSGRRHVEQHLGVTPHALAQVLEGEIRSSLPWTRRHSLSSRMKGLKP
jgi:hypothetical protein